MGLHVGAKVGSISKGTGAVLAAEGLFAGVGADVSLQQPWTGEGLVADVALVREGVGSEMHFHGAGRFVEFAAGGAAVALLGLVAFGGLAVELNVFGEAGIGGVGFVAGLALVSRCWFGGGVGGSCWGWGWLGDG